MQTAEVIALADEIQAHLERGDLAGLGPIDLGLRLRGRDVRTAVRVGRPEQPGLR